MVTMSFQNAFAAADSLEATPAVQLTENSYWLPAPKRNLGADDLVDDDEFDADDDNTDNTTTSSKMAPANTRKDDEKSQNIKKFSQATEAEIVRMLWCGESTNIIIGQTIKGQVYRSSDNGQTWEFKHDYNKLEGVGQSDKQNLK